ncbi:MAG: CIA30 family protein [Planctomycetota bacterium]
MRQRPALLVFITAMYAGPSSVQADQGHDPAPAEPERASSVLLTDFTEDELNARWRAVNDDVMGGRSMGGIAFEQDEANDEAWMRMSGSINTNGGGFTSARMSVDRSAVPDPEIFDAYQSVRLRIRLGEGAAGRPLALRLEDDVRRRLGINFRAVLPIDPQVPEGQWQTLTVRLADLAPTHHGNRLDPTRWAPLDASRVVRLGIMLNDTHDGPYVFDVGSVELVR